MQLIRTTERAAVHQTELSLSGDVGRGGHIDLRNQATIQTTETAWPLLQEDGAGLSSNGGSHATPFGSSSGRWARRWMRSITTSLSPALSRSARLISRTQLTRWRRIPR